ncbi:hypothetical protein [Billgrantia antri]|uniref:hypothetical protein n=1 Tax=Billgrantia antri TaxID=2846777 RepID=UPI003B21E3CD
MSLELMEIVVSLVLGLLTLTGMLLLFLKKIKLRRNPLLVGAITSYDFDKRCGKIICEVTNLSDAPVYITKCEAKALKNRKVEGFRVTKRWFDVLPFDLGIRYTIPSLGIFEGKKKLESYEPITLEREIKKLFIPFLDTEAYEIIVTLSDRSKTRSNPQVVHRSWLLPQYRERLEAREAKK